MFLFQQNLNNTNETIYAQIRFDDIQSNKSNVNLNSKNENIRNGDSVVYTEVVIDQGTRQIIY